MKQEQLRGLKAIIFGLMAMVLVYAAASAARSFSPDNKFDFVALGGLMLAWLAVAAGALILRKVKPEFEYAFYLSVASLLMLFVEAGLAVRNYLNNMGEQTFIQLGVMFFGYLALLGMILVFRLMMEAVAPPAPSKSGKKTDGEWKTVFWVGLVIIAAGTLFLPLTSLFSATTGKILAGLTLLLIGGTELYWCVYINKGAMALKKAKVKNK